MRPILLALFAVTYCLIFSVASRTLSADPPATRPALPEGWTRFDADHRFSFIAPGTTESQPVKGDDSYVGRYVCPTLTVSFDYGRYSDPLDETAKKNGAEVLRESINGHEAKIVIHDHTVSVYIAKVGGKDSPIKLQLDVEFRDPATQKEALAVVRSIEFPAVTTEN